MSPCQAEAAGDETGAVLQPDEQTCANFTSCACVKLLHKSMQKGIVLTISSCISVAAGGGRARASAAAVAAAAVTMSWTAVDSSFDSTRRPKTVAATLYFPVVEAGTRRDHPLRSDHRNTTSSRHHRHCALKSGAHQWHSRWGGCVRTQLGGVHPRCAVEE